MFHFTVKDDLPDLAEKVHKPTDLNQQHFTFDVMPNTNIYPTMMRGWRENDGQSI